MSEWTDGWENLTQTHCFLHQFLKFWLPCFWHWSDCFTLILISDHILAWVLAFWDLVWILSIIHIVLSSEAEENKLFATLRSVPWNWRAGARIRGLPSLGLPSLGYPRHNSPQVKCKPMWSCWDPYLMRILSALPIKTHALGEKIPHLKSFQQAHIWWVYWPLWKIPGRRKFLFRGNVC